MTNNTITQEQLIQKNYTREFQPNKWYKSKSWTNWIQEKVNNNEILCNLGKETD